MHAPSLTPVARLQAPLRWFAAAALTAIAGRTMSVQFHRLIWDHGPSGGIDLAIFHQLVAGWFAGLPVYTPDGSFTYPPASYVLLWPLIGWLTVETARWWWAAAYVVMLAALVLLIARETCATTTWERAFVTLIILAMNAAGVCIGNGQLIVLLLPPLLAAIFLVARGPASWPRDLIAATLFVTVLVKPTVTAPFFWLLLFLPGRVRPALITAAGYATLTMLAAWLRNGDVLALLHQWIIRGAAEASAAGYGNLQLALSSIALSDWILPASLVVLAAVGTWIYRHRHADLWLLLGVTGVVARIWSYHRVYDDVLIVLPAVALYRVARQAGSPSNERRAAGSAAALLVATLVAPGPWHDIAQPWRNAYDAMHVIVWLMALSYLMRVTARARVYSYADRG